MTSQPPNPPPPYPTGNPYPAGNPYPPTNPYLPAGPYGGPPPHGGPPYAGPPPGPSVPVERPPVPWWAAVLAVIGVAVVVVAVVIGVAATVVAVATRTSTTDISQDGVREIRITGVTGGASITVDPRADGAVTGTARATTSWQEAEVRAVREGDVLLLEAECPDQGWPRRCEVGYQLVVDPETDVRVDIVTGGLRAQGLAGDVEASITAGGVLLTDVRSDEVDATVTTGGIALQFAEPPTRVRATATTGGVTMSLPDDGLAYDVRTAVSVGEAGVHVPTDPAAPRSIEATTTVGGIDIHPEGWDDGSGWETDWDSRNP
jgi:hypothetical protein